MSVFQALLAHDKIDPNLPGEKGYTALHYCAYKDRDECAIILVRIIPMQTPMALFTQFMS